MLANIIKMMLCLLTDLRRFRKMNCYFHPEEESVVTCAKCGVGMCRNCEINAFFRLDGRAVCNRCSLSELQSRVGYESSWLKKRAIKLIICAIFIVIGLICLANQEIGIAGMLICWFISGIVANIGVKKDEGSFKSQAWNAMFEYEHPFMSLIFKIVGCTIAGPLMLIAGFIGYLRTKSAYNSDMQNLQSLQDSM